MSDELISKKDLLLETGISYGQLYRWKRKDLIPEEWFIRKSTFTGQETFFPKAQILERIAKIQTFKDQMSLDELADLFSPRSDSHTFEASGSSVSQLISPAVLHFYQEVTGFAGTLDFDRMLVLYALDQLLQAGTVSLDEGKLLIQCLEKAPQSLTAKNYVLVMARKMGVTIALLTEKSEDLIFDEATKIIAALELLAIAQELKGKLI